MVGEDSKGQELQFEMIQLVEWAKKWQMEFMDYLNVGFRWQAIGSEQ